jgi:hypothetical protein
MNEECHHAMPTPPKVLPSNVGIKNPTKYRLAVLAALALPEVVPDKSPNPLPRVYIDRGLVQQFQ